MWQIFAQVPELFKIITADGPCRAKYSVPVCILHDMVVSVVIA